MFQHTVAAMADRLADIFDETEVTVVAGQIDPERPNFPAKVSIDRVPHFQGQGGANRLNLTRIAVTAAAINWPWQPDRGDRFVRSNGAILVVATVDGAGEARPCFWVDEA
ncbi:hypothetical protein [Aurantimonas sp. 22II-16-19i]|uniref:hypothetical protein n=1 Tax=Aurantimonas sp. 22II-16-19i TaxID=1317114 RepID=UPI0009F7C5C6|nr:hypothetical protein [Aurantimonas sp. 22II-16-19i]ORE89748.1 hypothetical protein ATO4_23757 [Aurantimonas sp. 22II-16-19i]